MWTTTPCDAIIRAFLVVNNKHTDLDSIPIEELPAPIDVLKAAIRESARARFREKDLTEDVRDMLRSCYVRLGFVATAEERRAIESFRAGLAAFSKALGEARSSGAELPQSMPEYGVMEVRWKQFARMADLEVEFEQFLSQFPLQEVMVAPPARHWWSAARSLLRRFRNKQATRE